MTDRPVVAATLALDVGTRRPDEGAVPGQRQDGHEEQSWRG